MNRTSFQDPVRVFRLLLLVAALVLLTLAIASPATAGGQNGELSVDCDGTTDQVETNCRVGEQQTFAVAIQATGEPASGYAAFQAKLRWDSAVLDYRPTAEVIEESAWPSCGVPARRDNRPGDSSVLWGCATFPAATSHDAGALVRLEFVCIAPGTSQLALVPREGDAQNGSFFITLVNGDTMTVEPALNGATVTCGDSSGGSVGDVDCSGDVTAIDAALTLQMVAGLVTSLPCSENADVNGDGMIDAIDAMLILQFVAGLLPSLG